MKAPASNHFIFRRKRYSIIGMTGDPFLSTDPYYDQRFYETYGFRKEKLCITRHRYREGYDAVNFMPDYATMLSADEYLVTRNVHEVIRFTGKIRIARDFIVDLNIPTGYQKPTCFKTVLDITLNDGRIVDIKDRSRDVEQARATLKKRYESGLAEQQADEIFSLSMDVE